MITGTITGIGRQESRRGPKGPFKVQEIQVQAASGKRHRFSLLDRAALSASLKGQTVSLEGYKVHNDRIYVGKAGTLSLGQPAPFRQAGNGQAAQPPAKPVPEPASKAAAQTTQAARAKPDRFAEACGRFRTALAEARKMAGELELSKGAILAMTITLSIYMQKHQANGDGAGAALLRRCFEEAKGIGRELGLTDDEVARVADTLFIGLTRNGF